LIKKIQESDERIKEIKDLFLSKKRYIYSWLCSLAQFHHYSYKKAIYDKFDQFRHFYDRFVTKLS
jgi:hypothetical protein